MYLFFLCFSEVKWNCTTCKSDINALGNYFANNSTGVKGIVEMLNGKMFCQNPALGLHGGTMALYFFEMNIFGTAKF